MDVIVNDASALIDIYKAGILEKYALLECRLLLPDVVEAELLSFREIKLAELGFEVVELDGDGVLQVKKIRDQHEQLSVADTFALVVAQSLPSSILLTGDGRLRKVAESFGVEVHGVLWFIDTLVSHRHLVEREALLALEKLGNDLTVRLPAGLLLKYQLKFSGG